MKLDNNGLKFGLALTVAILVASSGPVIAQEEGAQSWKSLKREAKRQKIDEMADEALAELFTKSIKAKTLYEKAYGWAAFDNLKLAFGFSGGGGNGVAIDTSDGTRTYMKMGTVGFGLGLGGQTYQVIFLFQDQGTFLNFVENGWQADAGARAAAGTSGVNAQTAFVNGLAVYQMTDKGLMANVDIAGTKYWKNKKLNK
jgi:lipid-binding SYLF domain-containing protein